MVLFIKIININIHSTKNNQPLVLLSLRTWNRKEEIWCIRSYWKAIHNNIEVVVVDNGSSDGTIEEIKDYTKATSLYVYHLTGCEEGFNVGILTKLVLYSFI